MTAVLNEVMLLIEKEYNTAALTHGVKHNSAHEAYSVMKEELEETCEAINMVAQRLEESFWTATRNDDEEKCKEIAQTIYNAALHAACECIQIAAMARKSTYGFNGGTTNE